LGMMDALPSGLQCHLFLMLHTQPGIFSPSHVF